MSKKGTPQKKTNYNVAWSKRASGGSRAGKMISMIPGITTTFLKANGPSGFKELADHIFEEVTGKPEKPRPSGRGGIGRHA